MRITIALLLLLSELVCWRQPRCTWWHCRIFLWNCGKMQMLTDLYVLFILYSQVCIILLISIHSISMPEAGWIAWPLFLRWP